MKKFILALALMASSTAFAQHYGGYHGGHGHHGGYHGPRWGQVVGGAILGAVVYDIYNRPVVIQPQPQVIVQQPQVVYQTRQECTPWIETQNVDGTITRTRTCNQ